MKYFVIFILLIIFSGASYYGYIYYQNSKISKGETPSKEVKTNEEISRNVEIIINNLEVPWEVAFIDRLTFLTTLRKGELLLIKNKEIIKRFNIKEVLQSGEGGLLGIAVHPNFNQNNFIYLYYTVQNKDKRENKVVRYILKNNELKEDKVIISDIRGNIYHNAGKIEFGPDKLLYITAGDALDEPAAQDKNQLAGKILRVKDDGSIPEDNPFGNSVYSYGHRNPQGLTWSEDGSLWSTEHGQSGAISGLDELNKIVKGGNYGWPDLRGNQTKDEFIPPEIHSGTETWAPGDTEYFNGKIFFTGLRGQALYSFNPNTKELKKFFQNEYGRLRAITLGPDGYFYITTSNKDGRGNPKVGDDKILKVSPHSLK